ncbi:unnamed protein product [Vicia faba]|uniref:Uncharacterized protein n=1 Tax=Vicia faba TaxID=3906 RepID=A0AAV1ANN9_VICFA|nr:unnamed protein product [Vicia faba]
MNGDLRISLLNNVESCYSSPIKTAPRANSPSTMNSFHSEYVFYSNSHSQDQDSPSSLKLYPNDFSTSCASAENDVDIESCCLMSMKMQIVKGYSSWKMKMRIYGRGCREFEGEIAERLEDEERLLVDEGPFIVDLEWAAGL